MSKFLIVGRSWRFVQVKESLLNNSCIMWNNQFHHSKYYTWNLAWNNGVRFSTWVIPIQITLLLVWKVVVSWIETQNRNHNRVNMIRGYDFIMRPSQRNATFQYRYIYVSFECCIKFCTYNLYDFHEKIIFQASTV